MKPVLLFIGLSFSFATLPGQQEITLEKIWKSREFSPEYVSGVRSMNDGIHYTSLKRDAAGLHLVKYAYASGKVVDTLVSSSDLRVDGGGLSFSDYTFNSDESKLLLATEAESIYRYSVKAHYYAYDLASGELNPITDFEKGKQQLAAFSPVANLVAFVRDNNLFVANLDEDSELQITNDGEEEEVINGAPDWVYEEEFGFARGFYWSPDGEEIAYYKFNESDVPEYEMAIYGGLYPEEYEFKYPKAGEENSEVRVFVYSLKKNEKHEVELGANPEQYIPRIKWMGEDHRLAIMRMNRVQNELEFLMAKTDESQSGNITVETMYRETSDTYIEINDNLIFTDDGDYFFWNSEKDGYNHIYLHTLSGEQVAQLTRGPWDVVEFYGADQKKGQIYFSAAVDSPTEQAVYGVDYKNAIKAFRKTGKSVTPEADNRKVLTKLTPNSNTNDASFSKTFDYFINYQSGADLPYQIELFDHRGKVIRELEMNEELRERMSAFEMSPKEFGSFKAEGGHDLNYWMIRPPDFDPTETYPALFMVYGGPGRNTVRKSWGGSSYLWHQMLAQMGYVIISVDPRGTMYRGRNFKHSTYMQLGKKETEDMISAAKHFGAMDFIDKSRLGMMGWSYGGYMSSLAITKGHEYFKLAIAVAPVTNWRFYDTIYTERFMRTPQENPDGYDDNSPINFVDLIEGHYLLIHGSADDNVHLQNTMEMVEALVQADKQFDLFIYPNKNHGIYGGNTRYHLFKKMTDFIVENL